MKKFFAILLTAAMLVSMFAVVSFASDYTFTVDGVDVACEDGQTIICTSLSSWAECNPNWANNVQLTPDGNGYKVVATSACPVEFVNNGDASDVIEASNFTDVEDDIYVILHGGETGSNPNAFNVGNGMSVDVSDIKVGATITFSGEIENTASGATKKLRLENNVAAGKSYTHSGLYRQNDKWEYDEKASKLIMQISLKTMAEDAS